MFGIYSVAKKTTIKQVTGKKDNKVYFRILLWIIAVFALSACTALELAVDLMQKTQRTQTASQRTSSGQQKPVPIYKVGDPYQIGGVWYYPERNLQYDETGIASWYGDEFAGRATANGEVFDPEQITAAHKTLPMPSVVRVTNLDNGRSLVLRLNDRGPYVAGRIIDLSRASARLLGFKSIGTARVRVQILAEQSLRLEQLAKQGGFPELHQLDEKPQITAAGQPKVTLTATHKREIVNKKPTRQSALELLSASKVGEVINVEPTQTDIWIQIGAFYHQDNAHGVLQKVSVLAVGQVTSVISNGQTLYRARLGPIGDVDHADTLLSKILNLGFAGARIVVE